MAKQPAYTSEFPIFAVTVDIVVLTIQDGELHVVAIERGDDPKQFAGMLALPGGFVRIDEDLVDAAVRELHEEAALTVTPGQLLQVGAYGKPGRDPRQRVVSVAYAGLIADLPEPQGGSDARRALLHAAAPFLKGRTKLAFDHRSILSDAVDRVRRLIEETPAATRFCPPTFTLGELREVYEAVWGVDLDPANFRKRVLKTEGFVVPTGSKRLPKGDIGRLAETYRRGPAKELNPPLRQPHTYFHADVAAQQSQTK